MEAVVAVAVAVVAAGVLAPKGWSEWVYVLVGRPLLVIFALLCAPPLLAAFLEAYNANTSVSGINAVWTASLDALNSVAYGPLVDEAWANFLFLAKIVAGAASVVAIRLMFSREAFASAGKVEYSAEPLVFTYFGFYWSLFCYVGLGWTYSRRRQHAPNRAKDVELQWFAIASFYTLFDLPDIAGGTVGWSLNKYRPHLSKWKQSKTYYLLQLTVWPLQCIFREGGADDDHFVARFRRDLLYPDLRVAGQFPYPANYQDNVWTHNIHALVSKAQFAKISASRGFYFFDDKFAFLRHARQADPPFPVTPDLATPAGTVGLLFRKGKARDEQFVPSGLTLPSRQKPLLSDTKIYMKHTTLEMGAGVYVMELGVDAWEVVAVRAVDQSAFRHCDLDPEQVKVFFLAPKGDWVAQKALRNCAEVQKWCTPTAPLSTYRIITTCTAGVAGPESQCFYKQAPKNNPDLAQRLEVERQAVVHANPPQVVGIAFRAGRAGRDQDKLTDGAVFYGVNLATKCVGLGTNWQQFTRNMPEEPSIALHPDSGVRVEGQSLWFDESSQICRDAHARLCPGVPIVGWDVALSELGPVLVEANAVFMPCYSQVDYRVYMDAMDHALRYIDANRDAEIVPETPKSGEGSGDTRSSGPAWSAPLSI